jgi:uncharacterized protein (TIGR00730 family)
MKSVAVFCGGSSAAREVHMEAARALGRSVSERGLTLVYGGAKIGLMGVLADAALAAGGEVIGVIPQHLVAREGAHQGLSDLRLVGTMLERKALIAELSDAFVALPGGFGTLDELFEMLTWTQIGVQTKPCGVLNVDGYYDHLLAWVAHAADEGLVRRGHLALLAAAANVDTLLSALAVWSPPVMPDLTEKRR